MRALLGEAELKGYRQVWMKRGKTVLAVQVGMRANPDSVLKEHAKDEWKMWGTETRSMSSRQR
jgi:hypothetical protein